MQSSFTPGFDPTKIFAELESRATAYAKAQALYDSLDSHTKPFLAKLTLRFLDGECKSRVEAETYALASDEYDVHLNGVSKARETSIATRAAYNNALKLADLRTTQEASARTYF